MVLALGFNLISFIMDFPEVRLLPGCEQSTGLEVLHLSFLAPSLVTSLHCLHQGILCHKGR